MNANGTIWALRLSGLVLLALSIIALPHSSDFYGWLCNLPGDAGEFGSKLGNVITFAIPVLTGASLRLIMVGLRIRSRIVIVVLIFFLLAVLTSYEPELTGDNGPWAQEGVGFALWLFVIPAALAALILAAIPFGDRKAPKKTADTGK